MTDWEAMKRAGQTAFIDNETIRELYQQIRTNGHIPPSMDEQSLTQQIAQDVYPPSAPDPTAYAPQRDADHDVEPER